MQGFGWSLDTDGVELMYRSPVDVHVDEWVYTLLETVQRTGARRVLIDSLSDLQLASPDPIRFHEYMYSLVQRLARSNVSLFMTAELPDLFQTTNLSEQGISHLADNVVLLRIRPRGRGPPARRSPSGRPGPAVTSRRPAVTRSPARASRSSRPWRRPRSVVRVRQDESRRTRLPRIAGRGRRA